MFSYFIIIINIFCDKHLIKIFATKIEVIFAIIDIQIKIFQITLVI